MKTLFGKLLVSFGVIILLMIASVLTSFYLVYSKSYEEQIIAENARQALYVSRSLQSFISAAYKEVENLAFNSDVISMSTERQTPAFVSSVDRNDYFELLYAQGMDGMQTGRSSGKLGNRKERWWFVKMEQTRKPFVSESYYSVGTNMPCASVFYPIMNKAEMIGIMAGDIKLSALHDLVAETAEIDSYSFILDAKGVVVAHPDKNYQEELYNYAKLTKTVTIKDAAGKPIQDAKGNLTEEQSFSISEAYKAAIADMMKGNINSAKFSEEGKVIYLSYRPVPMNGSSDPWYVLSVKDEAAAMKSRNTVILAIMGSSIVIILIAFGLILFVARNISSPVKAIYSALEKIKDGNLTVKAEVKSKDEIGELSGYFNLAIEKIRDLIITIKNQTKSLTSVSGELSAVSKRLAGGAEETSTKTLSVSSAIEQVSANIKSIAGTAEESASNVVSVAGTTEQMSMNMNTIAAAIEEMSASINQISINAGDANKVANEATLKSSEATDAMSKLGAAAKEIGLVTEVIKKIADKTNLLALNATIEAASAGEAGKGFAVVANEIKELANQSAKSADDIAMRIQGIQIGTGEAVTVINDVSDIIAKINQSVNEISIHVGQQTKASNEIANNVAQANVGTKRVAESMGEVAKDSKDIARNAGESAKGASEVSHNIADVSKVAKQSAQESTQVNKFAADLSQIAGDLKDTVSKFEV